MENIVGKGENVGYKHFLLFLQCFFLKGFPFKVGKSLDFVVNSYKVNDHMIMDSFCPQMAKS